LRRCKYSVQTAAIGTKPATTCCQKTDTFEMVRAGDAQPGDPGAGWRSDQRGTARRRVGCRSVSGAGGVVPAGELTDEPLKRQARCVDHATSLHGRAP
jgi:hypothetical protein